MQDFLTWGAVIAAGGSIIAVVRFWIDIGKQQAHADAAAIAAAASQAKLEIIAERFAEYKAEAARTYATVKALSETEAQLASGFERGMQGIYTRLDGLTQRIDSLITLTREHRQ